MLRVVLTGCALLTTILTQGQTRKPNVIFILADDLGYGNISAYNSKSPIKTPNIDRLGQEGIQFTNFYSGNTVCAFPLRPAHRKAYGTCLYQR
jgi:hypothetical protein